MENKTQAENLVGSSSVTNLQGQFDINAHSGTATEYFNSLYSSPELIDTIVTNEAIELVYKRYSLITNGLVPAPPPNIYKHVYSRTDGSVKVVDGQYIPAQREYYSFD